MRIAIMQPYIFPYIGYFQLIKEVDQFVLLDNVNYINRGWINRNRILFRGEGKLLTIPLKNASQNKLISEIEIHNDTNWQKKWMGTIEQAYKAAPRYESSSSL